MTRQVVGRPDWLSRTWVARAMWLRSVTVDQAPSAFVVVRYVCAGFRSRNDTASRLPHVPSLDALTRHTEPVADETSTVAAVAPVAGSLAATRTTQQRRPPFSKNARTA